MFPLNDVKLTSISFSYSLQKSAMDVAFCEECVIFFSLSLTCKCKQSIGTFAIHLHMDTSAYPPHDNIKTFESNGKSFAVSLMSFVLCKSRGLSLLKAVCSIFSKPNRKPPETFRNGFLQDGCVSREALQVKSHLCHDAAHSLDDVLHVHLGHVFAVRVCDLLLLLHWSSRRLRLLLFLLLESWSVKCKRLQ